MNYENYQGFREHHANIFADLNSTKQTFPSESTFTISLQTYMFTCRLCFYQNLQVLHCNIFACLLKAFQIPSFVFSTLSSAMGTFVVSKNLLMECNSSFVFSSKAQISRKMSLLSFPFPSWL